MQLSQHGYMWLVVNSQKIVASHTIYSMLEKEPFSEFLTVQKWRNYVHPKDLYKLIQAEEDLLHTGNPVIAEYRLITESGRHRFVNHHMYLTGIPNMERKIMSIVQDVTEQKNAEIILEAMNEGFFELDKNFAFRKINLRALKFWGLEHDDAIEKDIKSMFPQMEGTAFYQLLLQAKNERINLAQDVIDPVTGHWLHISATPYSDGLIVIFYDIQNEKKAEEKVITQHKLLKQAEEIAQVGSWDYNVHTKEFLWSDGMYRLFDLEKGQAIRPGIYLDYAVDENDTVIAQKIVDGIEKDFEPFEETMRIKHNGSYRTIRVKATPMKNEKDEVEKMLGVDMDISEMLKSQYKIGELNKSLFEMNKDLNVLNAELKNFNAIAANNYAETLRSVYINLETIVTTDARNLSNSSRANLRRAQAAIQKMKLLTNDINHYLELYDIGIKKELINPNGVFIGIKEKMQKKIEDANATIIVHQLPNVVADPILFLKLMVNIIDNSIKFKKPDADPVIDVDYSLLAELNSNPKAKENTAYTNITVKDNGTGFQNEEKEKVFDLFTQLEQGKHRGSGIGLAICKKIMEMHGGFINAESEPGKGTSIHCYFPS
jgi:signal transduction histidine kinase